MGGGGPGTRSNGARGGDAPPEPYPLMLSWQQMASLSMHLEEFHDLS